MANINAPFGFRPAKRVDGAAPNFNQNLRKIATANATAIYTGDPLVSLNTGYVTLSTAGSTVQTAGIAVGFSWLSKTMNRRVYMPYWPGNGDANGDVDCYICDDPGMTFLVQVSGSNPVALANVGNNIDIAVGTGNTATGLSGATVAYSTIGTTTTLPFRIVSLSDSVNNDNTSQYNQIYVAFNNQDFKSLTGI